jgi:hypothetical protein
MKMTLAFMILVGTISGAFALSGLWAPGMSPAVGLLSVGFSVLIIWIWLNRRDLWGGLNREIDAKPPPEDWKQTWDRIQKDRSTER